MIIVCSQLLPCELFRNIESTATTSTPTSSCLLCRGLVPRQELYFAMDDSSDEVVVLVCNTDKYIHVLLDSGSEGVPLEGNTGKAILGHPRNIGFTGLPSPPELPLVCMSRKESP